MAKRIHSVWSHWERSSGLRRHTPGQFSNTFLDSVVSGFDTYYVECSIPSTAKMMQVGSLRP